MNDAAVHSGLEAFDAALKRYLVYNKRNLGEIIENRARRLQWELFRQFKDIAPSKEKLDAEAAARGYRTKRRKGKDGKTLSFAQEMALRKRSIRFLSVSFLVKAWKAKKEGQSGTFAAFSRRKKQIGQAIVRTARGERNPRVRILSFLAGAVKQNQQRGIVTRALNAQAADMDAYTLRKQQEAMMKMVAKVFNA